MYHFLPETHLGGKQNDGNQATPTVQTVEVANIITVVIVKGCFQTNNSNTKGNQLQTKMDQLYNKLVFMPEDSVNNYGWKIQWVKIRRNTRSKEHRNSSRGIVQFLLSFIIMTLLIIFLSFFFMNFPKSKIKKILNYVNIVRNSTIQLLQTAD